MHVACLRTPRVNMSWLVPLHSSMRNEGVRVCSCHRLPQHPAAKAPAKTEAQVCLYYGPGWCWALDPFKTVTNEEQRCPHDQLTQGCLAPKVLSLKIPTRKPIARLCPLRGLVRVILRVLAQAVIPQHHVRVYLAKECSLHQCLRVLVDWGSVT